MERRFGASSDPGETEPLLKRKEQTCARCGRLASTSREGDRRKSRTPTRSREGDTWKPGTPSEPESRATPTAAWGDVQADGDLRVACRKGDLPEVKRILATGRADVNCRGVVGMTLVMEAARWRHRDVVKILVNHGADVSLVDRDGNNILHYASAGGERDTVEFVLSLDGVDVNSRGGWGRTPVMDAECEGHSDVVELLVSKGADVSLADAFGNNILHYACVRGDRKTVEFVLSLDVLDVNCRGVENRTPLMEVAGRGHRDLVELLVSQGADVSQVTDDGDNTLHWACVGGDRKTVQFVLSLNVVNINANYGETKEDVAKGKGHHQLLDLLESRGAVK